MGLDLSAAFDTVNNVVLLFVLNNCFGVDHAALDWIECNMRHSSFLCMLLESTLRSSLLTFLYPRGLGPVLFNTYTSTLQMEINKFEVGLCGYADDHGIYRFFNKNPLAVRRLP